MPQSDTSSTFKPNAMANASGVGTNGQGMELTIEILSADPTLTAGVPRVWFNTTDKKIKVSADGSTTYSSAALT